MRRRPHAAATALRRHPSRHDDVIQEKVLDIVAEKTGYPKDMLDLDLDLEADLGVDTVKQAEMFAAIRAAYGIARDENLKLRDFPTLAHVIRFAKDRIPAAVRPPPAPLPPRSARHPSRTRRRFRRRCSTSSPRRPAIRKTCWIWTWTSRPISAWTPSSRPRSSPPFARATASRATRI